MLIAPQSYCNQSIVIICNLFTKNFSVTFFWHNTDVRVILCCKLYQALKLSSSNRTGFCPNTIISNRKTFWKSVPQKRRYIPIWPSAWDHRTVPSGNLCPHNSSRFRNPEKKPSNFITLCFKAFRVFMGDALCARVINFDNRIRPQSWKKNRKTRETS